MASTTTISNPILTHNNNNTTTNDRRKRKKKKAPRITTQNNPDNNSHIKWKSQQQQQSYSTKLLRALSQLRINETDSAGPPRRGRAVREAADRALAVTAKGRTRWSRALLISRLKLKFKKAKRQRGSAVAAAAGANRAKKPKVSVLALKGKNLPAVQRKVKVLGRLVPGCKKEPLPVILEEATDYIAALEMQVRAMSALAELLSGGSSSNSSSGSAGSLPPT